MPRKQLRQTRRAYSYDIRIQREGADWMSETLPAWGIEKELPQEWEATRNDPSIVHAVIFHASQRHLKKGQRRKILDEYTRP